MSLDLFLISKKCKYCGRYDQLESLNCTYNLSPMWYKIYPDSNEMIDIDNMSGFKAKVILKNALNELISNSEEFKKLNPKNGWGSYEFFLALIKNLLELSEKYSNYIWKSYR